MNRYFDFGRLELRRRLVATIAGGRDVAAGAPAFDDVVRVAAVAGVHDDVVAVVLYDSFVADVALSVVVCVDDVCRDRVVDRVCYLS